MNKSSKKILGTCSGILIVAAMIVAGYFLLNKQVQKEAQENVLPNDRSRKNPCKRPGFKISVNRNRGSKNVLEDHKLSLQ